MINIKIDSRKIVQGDTFVALKGSTVDGHDFINKAIENGATKVVIDHDIDCSVEKIIVDDTEKWLTDYVSNTYQDEINKLDILGVTGTNGKTTTAYLTYQILNKLGNKTAYIGTIGFYLPDEDFIELPNTTPNILDLYELLLTAKEKGCKTVIMEVSSHALHQERVKGIKYKVAAFTNLTQDHLDYHKTMENYLEAKKLILKQLEGPMLINADDPHALSWEQSYNNTKTYGLNGKDYKILSYNNTEHGTHIKLNISGTEYEVDTNLRSTFNVYNYLTSLSLINNIGYSIEEIISVTNAIYPPKGRCEQIKVKQGEAVVDYAHTPDAVEKIIKAFTENKKGRVITLVGCGGDRDPKKRPIMGNIATENSDYVIFTSDNPRTEEPSAIMNDILTGVKTNNFEVELDRRKAITKALDMIDKDDVVLILGKGHEDYQILGHEKVHLDDAEEVRKYISTHK
ncbi:MAG TPA: UDP-N-acetylmuramoyl-L-alanyl-D-glutamate--2,6-diaminopimelate ligase [Firmicutes bacterium]|nr:UDP-N-acetylmuramoyl-L-alanyl-D-glutamate--2,6-diaminopimelate ligase [Bacillota bacterium]